MAEGFMFLGRKMSSLSQHHETEMEVIVSKDICFTTSIALQNNRFAHSESCIIN